jgi:hypothetical protein
MNNRMRWYKHIRKRRQNHKEWFESGNRRKFPENKLEMIVGTAG